MDALAQLEALDQAESADKVDFVTLQFVCSGRAHCEALEEVLHRLSHQGRKLEEAAGRDPDFALLVFLDDLEAHTELLTNIGLCEATKLACQTKLAPNMDVDRIGAVLLGCMSAMTLSCGCLRVVRHRRDRRHEQADWVETARRVNGSTDVPLIQP